MPDTLSEAAIETLGEPLVVAYRIKEHKLDYSVTNRPLPTAVNDLFLATALREAGRFTWKRIAKPKDVLTTDRTDGRTVTYNERIRINWKKSTISGSAGKDATLRVLSIVIQNLVAAHERANPPELN